ncbi:MAG: hypothetical protein WC749_09770 [Dehalococcoidia bacterium]
MTTNVGPLRMEAGEKAVRQAGKVGRIRRIGRAVLRAITMDAEPIFKSKEWPYY